MDALHPHSRRPSWLLISVFWLGIGLFDATQTVLSMRAAGMQHAWTQLFIMQQVGWLPWILATPLAMFLGRRYPPTRIARGSTWGVHLVAILVIGIIWALWMSSLEVTLNPWLKAGGPDRFAAIWPYKFYDRLLASAILYAFIQAIVYVLDSRERIAQQQMETARLSEQLSKAQLNALRHQLEPHFLFNTLNAIAGLVREKKNDDAVNTIVRLSDFLRRVVKDSERSQVPLLEEVQFLEQYLDIQKVRLGEKLQAIVDVPKALLQSQVPNLVLQPLVENAIKHGIAKRAHGGAVRVDASCSDGMLCLNVYNDGPQLSPNWQKENGGTGIANLRDRLQILYGSKFKLQLENRAAAGVLASVSIPHCES